MKRTVYQLVLLTVFANLASARFLDAQNVLDRPITTMVNNQPLKTVLDQLSKQVDVRFTYSPRIVETQRRVSLVVTNKRFADVLDQLLKPIGLHYMLKGHHIILQRDEQTNVIEPTILNRTVELAVAERSVSGRVVDEKGMGLPGVNVLIKGTSRGSTTDREGNYRISVPNGTTTLVFSFVGYKSKEVAIGNQSIVDVELATDNKALDEVVVVGYGAQKKINMTGAVSTIETRTIENRPVTNAVDALQGAAAGLIVTRSSGQPGQQGWNMNIRGFSSLNGTNNPLVIIDGVEGDLTKLNPNDIASISVLKDAASASIFGAKAAGGVLVVTTKKGTAGKITVNYTSLFTVKTPYATPERVHSWEEADYGNVANFNVGNSPQYMPDQIRWMKSSDSNYVANDPYRTFYYYDNNQIPQILRKTSPSQNHNISVQGGDDRNQYFIGLGYYQEQGVFRFGSDANQRYNGRINLTNKFGTVFSLDSRLSFTNNNVQSPPVSVNGDYGLLFNIYSLRLTNPTFLPGSNETKYFLGSGSTYPQLKDGGYSRRNENILDGVFTLKAENFVKGLALRLIYNPNFQQINTNLFAQTVLGWTMSNNVPVQNTFVNNPNSLTKQRTSQTTTNVQALADYDLNLGDAHTFHLLGGFQYQDYNYDYVSLRNTSLVSNTLPSVNYTTNATISPDYLNDNIQTNAWVSYFGRFNYSYRDKYFLEATVRNDASSRLAPAYRTQTYPSVSAGWRLNQEGWFQSTLPVFDEFKLRASWGNAGNAQLGQLYTNNYNYIPLLNSGASYPFNNAANPSLYQSSLPSASLGWETVTTSDAGLDMALFKNRLTASFDYFVRTNNNMLVQLPQPALLGVNPSTSNGASMRTQGWEVTLGWRDRINKFNYWANLNLGDNQNKIIRFDGNIVYSEGLNVALPGMPINSIFGYQSLGYFQTKEEVLASPSQFNFNNTGPGDIKFQDVNGDGKITGGIGTLADHGDMVYLGNTSPRYNFGLNFGAQWKGFDLSVFFQGTGERKIMMYPKAVIPLIESWRNPMRINMDYWTPDNPNARFPRPYRGTTPNSYVNSQFVQDGAYVRLKNLQLGYTIPASLTNKIKLRSVRVFFSGQDIWQLTKMWYPYYDAESPNNVSFNYPFFRSYAAGLNVTF